MATWPENPRLIGTRIPRLDGLAKASGQAKYPSDVRPEGTLFGVMLYSPYAHAKVKSIDISAAEKMPGRQGRDRPSPRRRRRSATRATTSPPWPPRPRSRPATPSAPSRSSTRSCRTSSPRPWRWPRERPRSSRGATSGRAGPRPRASPKRRWPRPTSRSRGRTRVPVITHVCLESHGLTVKWDGPDKMTVWASTQTVQVVAGELADAFSIPAANVTVLTDYMGGGFGSKFGADVWGRTAAELAKKAGGAGQDVPRPRAGAPGRRAIAPAPRPRSSSGRPRTASSSP